MVTRRHKFTFHIIMVAIILKTLLVKVYDMQCGGGFHECITSRTRLASRIFKIDILNNNTAIGNAKHM